MIRFIHSADWQLGKAFGRFEPHVRSSLSEARFDAIDALGRAASEHGSNHVLVAGDVFDTEGPEDRTIVQALSRMARYPCRWWLLPGNHDRARSNGLWDRIRAKNAPNVVVLAEPEPHEIEDGVWLLPAPLMFRHESEDPTGAFDAMPTPGAVLRLGLAHGSIRDFSSRGETPNQIAPDRAQLSSLDYLALGDWHGTLEVGPRTWYAGTPETDRFERDAPGQALLIELAPSVEPTVSTLRTGKFQWLKRDWRVDDQSTFDAECDELLGQIEPANTLLQLTLAGITGLADRVAIISKIESDLQHQLRYLDLRADELVGRPTEDDLAALNIEGILGTAATKLQTKIEAGGPEALLARQALERLFVEYAKERLG